MNARSTIFSCVIPLVAMFFISLLAEAKEYEQSNATEVNAGTIKSKYRRIVLFGDSQLDTGNVTKKINITSRGLGSYDVNLPIGAPFTSGKGNMAQQLSDSPYINGNQVNWESNIELPMILGDPFRIPIQIQAAGGNTILDNSRNVNMAQGGAKMMSHFPGSEKTFLKDGLGNIVDAALSKTMGGGVFSSFAKSIVDRVIDQQKKFDVVLIEKISNQPANFKSFGGKFDEHDLAIVMAGGNDVIEQGYTGARNILLAGQEMYVGRQKLVEDVAALGAKNILWGNIPDLSVTPMLIDWKEKDTNILHAGSAIEKKMAVGKITDLTSEINEKTTISALNLLRGHPGTNLILFDIFKLSGHIARNGKNYGIDGDLKGSCDSSADCRTNKNTGVNYFTQDGLHPSEKASEVLAGAFNKYRLDPAEPLRSRLDEKRHYDPYLDAFADITGVEDRGDFTVNVNGGVLDLSLQTQADALSRNIGLNGALLYFGNADGKNKTGSSTQQLSSNIFISAKTDGYGGGGIEVSDEASRVTYTGSASGGALLKSGLGELVLTGDNEIKGLYIVSGTLKVGDGYNKGWLKGDIYNNSSLVFDRSDDKQFSYKIDGSGSLVKTGGGMLDLTGSGGFKGLTDVKRGGLGFSGLFESTDVLVNKDAVVYGTGKVRSLSLEEGAIISPGNSIGLFNIAEDLTFKKGSFYKLDANPTGLSDMIEVGGVATVEGGNVLVAAHGGEYSPSSLYTILSAKKGVTGRFDGAYANLAFLEPRLKYGKTDVSLLLLRNDIQPVDLCQNGNAKAACASLLPLQPPITTVTLAQDTEPPSVISAADIGQKFTVADLPAADKPEILALIGDPHSEPKATLKQSNLDVDPKVVAASIGNGNEQALPGSNVAPVLNREAAVETVTPISEVVFTDTKTVPTQRFEVTVTPLPPDISLATVSTKATLDTKPNDSPSQSAVVSAPVSDLFIGSVDTLASRKEKLQSSLLPSAENQASTTQEAPPQQSGAAPALSGEGELLVSRTDYNNLLGRENSLILNMSRPEFTEFSKLLSGEIHAALKAVVMQETSFSSDTAFKRIYETELGLANPGAWGYVYGSEGHQQGGNGISSLSRNTQGFIFGADAWLEDNDLSIGVFGGHRKTSVSQGASSAAIGTYNLGVYGSKRYDSLSARFGASVFWHDIETKRKIFYTTGVATPNSNYHGNTAQLFSELAYDVNFDKLKFERYIGLTYNHQEISAFSEKKDLFSLSGRRGVKDMYSGKLGVRMSYLARYNKDTDVDFRGGVGISHAFSDVISESDIRFNSHGETFRISGPRTKKNVTQLDGKVTMKLRGGLSVGVDYMLESASNLHNQSISAFGSWGF
ncbi:autotransporter domain-containing protein [Pseudomonas sp. 1912-s]|uniref:autotransporter domain-containing protein n=1 Tax=Pseudomonas sp. 1912-s TaxID=3033802 RepID=UPI0023DF479F|nr:autotransporter domain-containing protein [Pseudomonas sp. 1912-s]MDF3202848.1 autotransporter domain-containing protein [Pseudomonas sp. 1912-s]